MEKATAVPSPNARVVQIEIRQAAVVRKRLGMFENVANTPNRVNQGSRGAKISFGEQKAKVLGCRYGQATGGEHRCGDPRSGKARK